jgi:hypothetical protein
LPPPVTAAAAAAAQDTYRIGTMLELVREVATGLADNGCRVK